jgi:DMSO/TMAO reductase YedYZ molybdopterin-dependent catalytic subunit
MIAFAMTGEQLPLLNGFPLRLVVSGWCGVYWVKMLNNIEVLDQPDINTGQLPATACPIRPTIPPAPRRRIQDDADNSHRSAVVHHQHRSRRQRAGSDASFSAGHRLRWRLRRCPCRPVDRWRQDLAADPARCRPAHIYVSDHHDSAGRMLHAPSRNSISIRPGVTKPQFTSWPISLCLTSQSKIQFDQGCHELFCRNPRRQPG